MVGAARRARRASTPGTLADRRDCRDHSGRCPVAGPRACIRGRVSVRIDPAVRIPTVLVPTACDSADGNRRRGRLHRRRAVRRGPAAGQITPMIVGGAIAVCALVGYAGSRRLRTMNIEARLTGLPRGLDGLRIAQVSDLHVGPHTSAHTEACAPSRRGAAPEVIAITGDQVDDYAPDIEDTSPARSPPFPRLLACSRYPGITTSTRGGRRFARGSSGWA